MRQILFRGQRISGKEWVYGYYICNCYIGLDNKEHKDPQIANDEDDRFDVISKTVGQYTGLTDKNGKKIFEGDIVKVKYDNTVGIVSFGIYEANDFGFYIKWVGTYDYIRYDIAYWADKREIEVIGNIFDNPELLKGSEDI